MQRCAVTTTRKIKTSKVIEAAEIARFLGIPYLAREDYAIPTFLKTYDLDYLYIVGNEEDHLSDGITKLKWHPNMAFLKIRDYQLMKKNPLLEAFQLENTSSILDCTLGLAGDALFISNLLSEGSRYVGVEGNPLIALLTKRGLENIDSKIEVFPAHYNDFLTSSGNQSYDIVYFDPMFEENMANSSAMKILKTYALDGFVTQETIENAMRVSRKRVVIKMRYDFDRIQALNPTLIVGDCNRKGVCYLCFIK